VDTITNGIEMVAGLIIIPWVVWVSSSIFNQKTEIALLKQILEAIKEQNENHKRHTS